MPEIVLPKAALVAEQLLAQQEQEITIAEISKDQPVIVEVELEVASQELPQTEHLTEVIAAPIPEQFEVTLELPEPQALEIEFEAVEELTFVITEQADDTTPIYEQTLELEPVLTDTFEISEIVQPTLEVEEEVQRAALLWAEQWEGEGVDAYIDTPQQLEEMRPTIIDLLPIDALELVEKLETLPEASVQEVAAILETVLETVKNFEAQEFIAAADLEQVAIKLEQMVERLLVCLEIERDELYVADLVKALLSGELELEFDVLLAWQNDGMHERKYTSAWIMAVLNQQLATKPPSHSFIGKCIMSLSFSDVSLGWAA